jgi:hypothetical protein
MGESDGGDLKSRSLGPFPLIAIVILSLITLMVVTYVLVQCWNEYHAVSLFSADVRDKFDSYKIEAEDLQRLVSLLVAFSSLYALVLGVSSYISAQGLLERSRENAEQIERQRKQIEESFPFFKKMGKRMNEVKENLERLMPDSDVRDDYYDRLDPCERQNIEMVEQSAISWLYFLDFDDAAELASEIFRNLGKYYSAKYKRQSDALKHDIEESLAPQTSAVASCIDAKERERRLTMLGERAGFFLKSSIEKNRKNFLAYNDLAYLTQDIEGDGSIAAEELYRRSIRLESKQQRAYYDLAIILSFQKKYSESESLSTKALEYINWQAQPNSDRGKDIVYNRACYRDRIAREAKDAERIKWLALAEADLVKACGIKDLRRLKLLNQDCVPEGDLGIISSTKPDLIDNLRQILQG